GFEHLAAVDAYFAAEVERIQIGKVDPGVNVSLEEALQREALQLGNERRWNAAQDLRARRARHPQAEIDLGHDLQLATVLEFEGAGGHLDRAGQPCHQAADLSLKRLQIHAPLIAIDGGVETQGEAGVFHRFGGELLVRDSKAGNVQLSRQRDFASGEARLDGSVDFGALGFQDRGGQHVGDFVEREALGPQRNLSVDA